MTNGPQLRAEASDKLELITWTQREDTSALHVEIKDYRKVKKKCYLHFAIIFVANGVKL